MTKTEPWEGSEPPAKSCARRSHATLDAKTALDAIRACAAVLVFALVATPARADDDRGDPWPAPAHAEVTLIGAEPEVRAVRDAIEELVSRDGVAIAWSRLDRLRLDHVLDAPAAQGAPTSVWVDLAVPAEARIYFRAAGGQRFVIRRLPLRAGLDAVAVEEIAQIVKSVLRALGSGATWALTLPEARAALSTPATPVPPSASAAGRSLTLAIGSAAIAEVYAPELPVVGRVDVSVAGIVRPGSLGGWLGLGYGLPARFRGQPLGAELHSFALRGGLLWEPWRAGRMSVRLALGAGLDRVGYQPRPEAPGSTPAAGGGFWIPLACAGAGIRAQISRRFALAVDILAALPTARVHYDAYDADGARGEVLVPFRFRPGLSLGLEIQL
jgi:hypothetical protein